jgi:hypothetical protein
VSCSLSPSVTLLSINPDAGQLAGRSTAICETGSRPVATAALGCRLTEARFPLRKANWDTNPARTQSSSGSLGVESPMHVAVLDGAGMAVNAIGGCVKLKRSERSSSAFVSA